MKKIYSSQNKVILYLLQSRLEEKGIHCFIKNENPPLAGEIPPMIAWPELWVIDDLQQPNAKKIVQDELAKDTEKRDDWQCPECSEELENQFDICWKCGMGRV
jgi:hypothetical protein